MWNAAPKSLLSLVKCGDPGHVHDTFFMQMSYFMDLYRCRRYYKYFSFAHFSHFVACHMENILRYPKNNCVATCYGKYFNLYTVNIYVNNQHCPFLNVFKLNKQDANFVYLEFHWPSNNIQRYDNNSILSNSKREQSIKLQELSFRLILSFVDKSNIKCGHCHIFSSSELQK